MKNVSLQPFCNFEKKEIQITQQKRSHFMQEQTIKPSFFWRTEPGIDTERQKFLADCLAITPDIQQGIYPFKDIKLTRADIEWLLITHEGGRGPVDWNDVQQRSRIGLDLRGAH